ncbi:MAG: DUF5675 family protein [Campylobacter sp.]
MILKIQRFKNVKNATIGKFELTNNDEILLNGYSLEPAGDDCAQANQNRRIPQGDYKILWHKSPKFNRTLPLLYNQNVSKSRYILIHNGNYQKDTQGCILLGNLATDEGVFNSNATMSKFLQLTINKDFKVKIINDFK